MRGWDARDPPLTQCWVRSVRSAWRFYPWAVAQWSAAAAAPVVAAAPPAPGEGDAAGPMASAGIPPVFRNLVFGEILLFVAILAAAYAYAWRKGVFEWR